MRVAPRAPPLRGSCRHLRRRQTPLVHHYAPDVATPTTTPNPLRGACRHLRRRQTPLVHHYAPCVATPTTTPNPMRHACRHYCRRQTWLSKIRFAHAPPTPPRLVAPGSPDYSVLLGRGLLCPRCATGVRCGRSFARPHSRPAELARYVLLFVCRGVPVTIGASII